MIFDTLMERLDFSIVSSKKVLEEPFRLDSEYYSKSNLALEDLIISKNGKTIEELGGIVDCSAFYPSITGDYSYDKSLIPFLRVNEIKDGLVTLTENTVYLPQKVLDINTGTIARAYPGDLIIAKGGNTLAKVGLVTNEYPVYATCRDVIILRTNKITEINKFYLWAFLHSKYGQDLMWRSASQTGQPHLTLPIIKNMHIPIYDKDIQDWIESAYKKSVDKQLASSCKFEEAANLLNNVIDKNDENSILEKPVIISLKDINKNQRIDAEYYKEGYRITREKIEKKSHWYLSDDEIIDANFTPDKETLWNYIELANVGVNGSVDDCLSDLGSALPTRARRLVKEGDVIISSIEGSLEKSAIITAKYNNCICSNGFYVLRTKKLNPKTLLVLMKLDPIQSLLKRACSGTILTAFSKDELKKIPLPEIDSPVQAQIEKIVDESFYLHDQSLDLLNSCKQKIEELITLADD